MKTFFALTLMLITHVVWAQNPLGLKVGDILLQPLSCWSCSLIEFEEETIYSHIGVVLEISPEVMIGEAYGKVRKVSFKDFSYKTEPGLKIKVIRFRHDGITRAFETYTKQLNDIFEAQFKNLSYDSAFRWNNFDAQGKEKLYCTEFLSKLFQAFLGIDTPVKRMHFQQNRDHWIKFFKGDVPDNQWGNSPGDFERSELFYTIGEL